MPETIPLRVIDLRLSEVYLHIIEAGGRVNTQIHEDDEEPLLIRITKEEPHAHIE